MVPQPSPTASRAIITVFAGLAVLTSVFRLSYRWRIRRFWWDDAWAGLSMCCELVLLIAFWIRTDVPGVGPLVQPRKARVVAYWIVSLGFTMVLYTARMSILFSAVKIIPPMMTLHRIAYLCAVLFACMWAALTVQKVYICAHDRAWESLNAPQCHLGDSVGILELVTDFIADGILIIIPLRLLWRVNLPRHIRKLLYSIFSASILVTVASVVHAYFLLGPSGLLEGLTANVECAVALIVANLAVVVAHIYRLVRNGDDLERSPFEAGTSVEITTRRRRFRAFTKRAGRFKTHITSTFFGKSGIADTVLTTRIDSPTEVEISVSSISKANDLFTPAQTESVTDARSPEETSFASLVGWRKNDDKVDIEVPPTGPPLVSKIIQNDTAP